MRAVGGAVPRHSGRSVPDALLGWSRVWSATSTSATESAHRSSFRQTQWVPLLQLNARIDHAPDCPPARQRPLTTESTAFSRRFDSRAPAPRSTSVLHVPAYSPVRPDTIARQVPFHPAGDFTADHPPRATRLALGIDERPCSGDAPDAGSGTAVHVPISVWPLLLVALHVFARPSCPSSNVRRNAVGPAAVP